MALIELPRDPSAREVRQFALGWLPAFCGAASLIWLYRGAGWPWVIGVAGGGALSVLVGLVRPLWMRRVFVGWMWCTLPIGWTVSFLLLAGIFFFIITPIGLVMRLARRDPLSRRLEPDAKTYWTSHRQESDPARYFRQF
jgi:Saxitoxin biosynthesis operon protein SxtJ